VVYNDFGQFPIPAVLNYQNAGREGSSRCT
jgi:hypothetical protein